jgi:integrase
MRHCFTINSQAALALEFTILTAARTGEVTGAKWSEFDRDAGIWTVPSTRMKAGREHRVPLSPRTLVILDMVEVHAGEYVFPAPRGGAMSNMAMALLLRRMGLSVTVPGFRSTFRDWSADQSDHTREVAEMALAHVIESRVDHAYRCGDLLEKRRKLMNDWAAYCATACTQMIAPPAIS